MPMITSIVNPNVNAAIGPVQPISSQTWLSKITSTNVNSSDNTILMA